MSRVLASLGDWRRDCLRGGGRDACQAEQQRLYSQGYEALQLRWRNCGDGHRVATLRL